MTNQDNADVGFALDTFFADGLISEILHVIKRGKEATVFCCRAGNSIDAEFLAAKVYKSLDTRAFRSDAGYQACRDAAFSRRDRRAFAKKTRHGREVQFGSWIAAEFETLEMLHAAGSDVPRPFARSGGGLLMEYVGDDRGAAPMMSLVSLPPNEARAAFDRIMQNIALWLRCDRVHGDLSPYNILYLGGERKNNRFPASRGCTPESKCALAVDSRPRERMQVLRAIGVGGQPELARRPAVAAVSPRPTMKCVGRIIGPLDEQRLPAD
jgi:RIO kinase 1